MSKRADLSPARGRKLARDPETGGGAKARGSLHKHRGVPPLDRQPPPSVNAAAALPGSSVPPPEPEVLPANSGSFADQTKSVSTRMAGIDPKTGKVIPHTPTPRVRALVKQWVATGADENEIAVLLNIRPGHLRQHYARELEIGKTEIDMAVGGAIISKAKKGDPRMAIFYAKARMGWRDGDSKPLDVSPFNLHIHL